MPDIRIADVLDEAAWRAHPAVRRPGVRPPHVRLLGGRRRGDRKPPAWHGSRRRRHPPRRPPPRAAVDNPFLAERPTQPAFNPFAEARRRWPRTRSSMRTRTPPRTRSRPAPRGRRGGAIRKGRRAAQARQLLARGLGGVGSYAKVIFAGRRAGGVLPVRSADRISEGAAHPRAVSAAAGLAAPGGDHLYRDDRRRPRRGLGLRLVARGL